MRALIVLSHPRRGSLTGRVADIFAAALTRNGHAVEWADLAAEGFDPVLREPDEPDWNDPKKVYSPEVRREMERIARNDATLMVFPVWWWSVPALLKGWIDRVWNNGYAYGEGQYPHRRVWMVGLAGSDAEHYAKRGYDTAMDVQLGVGILDYCKVPDRRVVNLYGTLNGDEEIAKMLKQAEVLAEEFAKG